MDTGTEIHLPTPVEELIPERRPFPRWPAAFLVGLVLIGALIVAAWQINVPYFALSPGPTQEVGDLIEIEDGGPDTFVSSGDLIMLTVSLQEVNAFEYVQGLLDDSIDLVEREIIRPADVSPDEFRRENREAMDESQSTAIAVALRHLGFEVTDSGEGVYVAGVIAETPADGVLMVGDVIKAVQGRDVTIRDDGVNAIVANEIGDTIDLTVDRNGELLDLAVTLIEHTQTPGIPMVGFEAETFQRRQVLPFDVDIDAQNIGGPSAGMMYALTIIDLLTEDDLTNGNLIAGTGTISSDGTVGAIGGVRQKVVAAQAAGAQFILVPEANYVDAQAVRDDGVEIYSIGHLDDALAVLDTLPVAGT